MKLSQWLTGSVLVTLLVVLFFIPQQLTSGFKAGGGGGTTVVTGTGIFTTFYQTTDQYGQTTTVGVVTSGTYVATTTQTTAGATTIVTTSAGQTTTSTSLGNAWLNIIISGVFKLLDPNGNLITSQTYELATETGTAADSLALDATYQVTGVGYDPSTLKVDCSSSGQTAQPSTADPNTPEIVNQGKVKDWLGLTSQSGHLTLASKITDLTGTKSWDHSRKLTASVGIMCTATAKKLPGYSLVGGDEVTAQVGPIVGQSHLNWNEPTPAPAPQPAPAQPSQPSQPTYTPTPSPSTPYSTTVAERFRVDMKTGGDGDSTRAVPGTRGDVGPGAGQHPADIAAQHAWGYSLLGFMSLIEVYGADSVSLPIQSLLLPVLATIIVLVVVFLLFRRKKKRRM